MNRAAFAALGIALLMANSVRAQETAVQSANREAITATYARFCRAMEKHDLKAMQSLIGPNYTFVSKEGMVYHRDTYIAAMRQWGHRPLRHMRVTFQFQKGRWNGSHPETWTETTIGAIIQKGKTILNSRSVTHDIWTHTAKGWQITRSIELKVLVHGQDRRERPTNNAGYEHPFAD